jgi:chromosome segregation ATPase
MADHTEEQLSRGVFTMARSVLQLEGGMEQAMAERDRAVAERDAAREEVRTMLAYREALAQHVSELEATIADLRAGHATVQREAQADMESILSRAMAGRKEIASEEMRRLTLTIDIRDLTEKYRSLEGRYLELGKLVGHPQTVPSQGAPATHDYVHPFDQASEPEVSHDH